MTDLRILDKYPNVQKYVEDYIKTDGITPCTDRAPNLIIWFRETLEKHGVDIPEFFDWDNDLAEDFYSWGHNSRWGHTFIGWLRPAEVKRRLEDIADIAEHYGDPDVDKIYPTNKRI